MHADIDDWIQTERLAPLVADVRARLDDDPGHDLAHCLRVAVWTVKLGGPDVIRREAIAAALLHDVVNIPKDSPQRSMASQLAADEARRLLPAHGFDRDAIDRIAGAIRDHSFSRGAVPESALGRALQDADRLEALGAIGILRVASTGARLGSRYAHADDPWGQRRELDDARYMVDHCFRKLLRLGSSMQTDAGHAEAARRTGFLRLFLRQLGHELGEAPPEELLG